MQDIKGLKGFLFTADGYGEKHLAELWHIRQESWLKPPSHPSLPVHKAQTTLHVCDQLSSSTHTHRDLQRQSFIPAYHFSFSSCLLPPIPPPCCSPVWPQINRVHSVQTHSVTVFNHRVQKSPLERSGPLQLQTGTQKKASTATRAHAYTPKDMMMISWIRADSWQINAMLS